MNPVFDYTTFEPYSAVTPFERPRYRERGCNLDGTAGFLMVEVKGWLLEDDAVRLACRAPARGLLS